jgi:hypothetical protein
VSEEPPEGAGEQRSATAWGAMTRRLSRGDGKDRASGAERGDGVGLLVAEEGEKVDDAGIGDQELAGAPPDLWETVTGALLARAEGRSFDFGDAYRASEALAEAALLQGGLDPQALEKQFSEREHLVRMSYDRRSGRVALTIEWADGQAGPVPSAPHMQRMAAPGVGLPVPAVRVDRAG